MERSMGCSSRRSRAFYGSKVHQQPSSIDILLHHLISLSKRCARWLGYTPSIKSRSGRMREFLAPADRCQDSPRLTPATGLRLEFLPLCYVPVATWWSRLTATSDRRPGLCQRLAFRLEPRAPVNAPRRRDGRMRRAGVVGPAVHAPFGNSQALANGPRPRPPRQPEAASDGMRGAGAE